MVAEAVGVGQASPASQTSHDNVNPDPDVRVPATQLEETVVPTRVPPLTTRSPEIVPAGVK